MKMSVAEHNSDSQSVDRPLRKMQDEWHLIADALPVLISHVDTKERYVFNNRAYETWFGIRREELRGRSVREVLGEDVYKHVEPHLHGALAGNEQMFEAIVQGGTGAKHKMLVNYIPHFNDAGAVHVLHVPVGVVDDPLPRDQLRATRTFVGNPYVIGEQVLPVARRALIGQELALHLNPDAPSCRITHSYIDYATQPHRAAGCDIL